MRAVIQRVSQASVSVDGQITGSIEQGLMILLGIGHDDQQEDIDWLVNKLCNMRIFSDDAGKMNLSLLDVTGSALVVSQFTLHASTKKGNRPSFIKAAPPAMAEALYEDFCEAMNALLPRPCERGVFGAMMEVSLINDGPVTIVIDSKNKE